MCSRSFGCNFPQNQPASTNWVFPKSCKSATDGRRFDSRVFSACSKRNIRKHVHDNHPINPPQMDANVGIYLYIYTHLITFYIQYTEYTQIHIMSHPYCINWTARLRIGKVSSTSLWSWIAACHSWISNFTWENRMWDKVCIAAWEKRNAMIAIDIEWYRYIWYMHIYAIERPPQGTPGPQV